MPTHPERGSVLVADLALAAAIVIAIAAIAAAVGGVASAQQDQREAARNAAVIAARTGNLDRAAHVAGRLAPGATITIAPGDGSVSVVVSDEIVVAHPGSGRIGLTIVGDATVPIAPYRSARD